MFWRKASASNAKGRLRLLLRSVHNEVNSSLSAHCFEKDEWWVTGKQFLEGARMLDATEEPTANPQAPAAPLRAPDRSA